MAELEGNLGKVPDQDPERTVEENFDTLRTGIPGFRVLADHGATLDDLTRRAEADLHEMTPGYAERAATIRDFKRLQQVPHDRYVDYFRNFPGFRGARDMETGTEVQVNPQFGAVIDQGLLELSLRDRMKDVSTRKTQVVVELDPEVDDVDGFVASAKRRLRRQGSDPRNLKKQDILEIDEKKLADLVEGEEVVLLPGTVETQLKSVAVYGHKIKSTEELQAVDAQAQSVNDRSDRSIPERVYFYRADFMRMSDEQIVAAFNAEVGNKGWTSARADYLSALHQELDARSIDYSMVGDEMSLSFANRVVLSPEGRLLIDNRDEQDAQPTNL